MKRNKKVEPCKCPKCGNAWQFSSESAKGWEILLGWKNIPLKIIELCPNCDLELMKSISKRTEKNRIRIRDYSKKLRRFKNIPQRNLHESK